VSEIPLDVQYSLSPADKFIANELKEFMEAYSKRNTIMHEISRLIAKRVDSNSTSIEYLLQLIDIQKEMIESLDRRISDLESRNVILR